MRSLITTLLILVIFVVGSFATNKYIVNSCEKLLEDIELLSKLVKDNEWDNSKGQLKKLKEQWKDTKDVWQLFLEHYEMDAIDISIARLDEYVEIEEQSLALGEMAAFRLLISHIKDKESLKLENIL